ncbi:hypothetical protein ACIQWN_17335 [Streptomyces vinaceus]|uniref:hypothetical protein n=1 Tax=Streptomyces vinaceus TaxID=1960 RepID=UPI0038246484
MTVTEPRFFAETVGRLRGAGHDVRHFALPAERRTVLRRLGERERELGLGAGSGAGSGSGSGSARARAEAGELCRGPARRLSGGPARTGVHRPPVTDHLTVFRMAARIAAMTGLRAARGCGAPSSASGTA